jgi:hypothetical protein
MEGGGTIEFNVTFSLGVALEVAVNENLSTVVSPRF